MRRGEHFAPVWSAVPLGTLGELVEPLAARALYLEYLGQPRVPACSWEPSSNGSLSRAAALLHRRGTATKPRIAFRRHARLQAADGEGDGDRGRRAEQKMQDHNTACFTVAMKQPHWHRARCHAARSTPHAACHDNVGGLLHAVPNVCGTDRMAASTPNLSTSRHGVIPRTPD